MNFIYILIDNGNLNKTLFITINTHEYSINELKEVYRLWLDECYKYFKTLWKLILKFTEYIIINIIYSN